MKYVLSIMTLFFLLFQGVFSADVMTNVGRIQSTSGYTGTIPVGGETKGFVGKIISDIFDPIGKILSNYILAFQNIINIDNTIPVWNNITKVFDVGIMSDNGSVVTVGGDFMVTGDLYQGGYMLDTSNPWPGSLWSQTGSVTYRLFNNIGIGVNDPSSKLEVAGKIEADEYCDRDGNNCFVAGSIGSLLDNCYICGSNSSTVQCEKFGGNWVTTSDTAKISCNVGGVYTKISYCKNGNSSGGWGNGNANCTAVATCNSGDIALRGRGWYKGAGSNYVTALDYNDTVTWHARVNSGLSTKSWGNPTNSTSLSYYANYNNGTGDASEYIIIGAQVECLDF